MAKNNNLVIKPVLQQELKKLENKLTRRMGGFDRQMKGFRNDFSAHKIAMELKMEDFQEKNEKSLVNFKDEILRAVDGVMKELVTMRQENIISTDILRRVNSHEDRLEIVEEKLRINITL